MSITWGFTILRRSKYSYPSVLQSLICLLLLSLLAFSSCSRQRLRNADLLFFMPTIQEEADSMDSAISGATGGGYTHVGIVEIDKDGQAWIIEATPKLGVHRSRIDKNWLAAQKAEGYRVDLKRVKGTISAQECILRAKSFIGQPYDFAFLPGCDALYCSELVYESYLDSFGRHIFKANPMNFRREDGSVDPYWTELFYSLGTDIPQGLDGTNPEDMSQDPSLIDVRTLN